MREYLLNLPLPIFVTLAVLLIIAVVIIALRGRISAKFGNKVINIGGRDEPEIAPSPTVIIKQKRSCGDCILLLMGEREKFEFKIRKETDKIMKTQMTFVEQKLIEIQILLLDNIATKISKDSIDESVQYKLIYGLLRDALHNIKDEIRRSFKDNGFWELDASDFSIYLRDRAQILSSMLIQYIRNIYPDRRGILEMPKIIKIIEEKSSILSDLIHDLYMYSREVKIETDKKIKNIEEEFVKWIDNFIV